jgi:hypothetical protein
MRALFSSGWARYLPVDAFVVAAAAAANATTKLFGADGFSAVDADAPLRHLVPAGRERTREQVADDDECVARTTADLDRFSRHAGLEPPATLGGLISLMQAYGIVAERADGRVVLVDPTPLVVGAGVLHADEVASEDRLRWRKQFEPLVNDIIRTFVEDARTTWTATLTEFGHIFEADPDSVRHALAQLCEEGDFTVDPAPEAAALDARITVTVDWAAFDENRISVGGFAPAWPDDGPAGNTDPGNTD